MSLKNEIELARKEIVSDGYEMSVGELISLYKEHELIINPDFQRLFRWSASQKTRFIESLLLGIPIPPIFVFQNDEGIWELIDGLQRLSTIFEFIGILRYPKGEIAQPISLDGTNFLPSLAGKYWEDTDDEANNGFESTQKLEIKRARIRIEILKKESDPLAKYELFQRLNTGGSKLTEQEVRNCVAVMLNKPFYGWLKECAERQDFKEATSLTEYAISQQQDIELALRFFVFRNIPYESGLDVHEYLDKALMSIASDPKFDTAKEGDVFKRTFKLLRHSLGAKCFRRWDGEKFKGKFLSSVFEVLSLGVSKNISTIEKLTTESQKEFLQEKAKRLWDEDYFINNSGAGISGSTRLAKLLSFGEDFLKDE